DEDVKLFEAVQGLEYIVIINKTDLEHNLDLDKVRELAGTSPVVTTSLIEEEGVTELEESISGSFFAGDIESADLTYVSNVRHIQLLKQAIQALEDAMNSLEMGMPLDIVQIDVTRSWEFLGEIIGDTASDSLIDQLFSQFCLGK